MKNFQDFIDSKKRMSKDDYNKQANDHLDGKGDVFVYQDYYYIEIDDYYTKKMGYNGREIYNLTLENTYQGSENLRRLELMLYNWYVGENEDEWLYYVGIHNPKTTPLYYKAFTQMGFEVEDISYSNDECDCLRLSMFGKPMYDVYMPNSSESGEGEYNRFHILELDKHDDRIERDLDNNLSLKEIIDWIESNLHTQAKRSVDNLNTILGIEEEISLDEYLDKHTKSIELKAKGNPREEEILDELSDARRVKQYFYEFESLDLLEMESLEPRNLFDNKSDIEYNEYLFVLDFSVGEAFRYTITPTMRGDIDVDCEWYEEFIESQNHRIKDCQWMITKYETLTIKND